MPVPYSEARASLTYVVRINSGEPTEQQTPEAAAKLVAESIYAGKPAAVTFKNAANLDTVRQNFNIRLDDHFRKSGYKAGFGYRPNAHGAEYLPK